MHSFTLVCLQSKLQSCCFLHRHQLDQFVHFYANILKTGKKQLQAVCNTIPEIITYVVYFKFEKEKLKYLSDDDYCTGITKINNFNVRRCKLTAKQ